MQSLARPSLDRKILNGLIPTTNTYRRKSNFIFSIRNGFEIYPNPTRNLFYISSNSDEIQSISVFNSQGEIVKSKFLTTQNLKYSIELDSCTEGIYIVQIKTKSNLFYTKISIVK